MIKDLLNADFKDVSIDGLEVHIIKKYAAKTPEGASFIVRNLSILLIKSGGLKIKLRDIVQDLSARDLIIISKNSFCTFLEVRDKLQLFLITVSVDFAVRNFLKKELIDSFYLLIRKGSYKIELDVREFSVLSLIYKLIYYVKADAPSEGYGIEIQRMSLNLFLYQLKVIYARYGIQETVDFSRKETLAIHFLTILALHYKTQHSVKFYAGALCVTAGHLNKVVRQTTGKNAKILIIEALISEAKSLLEDPQFAIAEIAEELQFTSSSVFSIFFKKHAACSPTAYRSKSTSRSQSR